MTQPQSTSKVVRKAEGTDVRYLCSVLARAFETDPLARHVLPDAAFRRHNLERIYSLYFNVFLPQGACYTNTGREGAALWMPPGKYPLSLFAHMRLLPGMARVLGLRRLPNAWRVLSHLDSMHPVQRKYWYLGVLGVEPARQRRGIGGTLMQPVLKLCDADQVGAYLETAEESNLLFYAAHGFRVMRESRIPDGPHVWHLWREASS